MGIALTANEAKALRDAIRTDYGLREGIMAAIEHDRPAMDTYECDRLLAEQQAILDLLDSADDVLKSVYQYPDEPDGFMYT
jgi:hypothetical protein